MKQARINEIYETEFSDEQERGLGTSLRLVKLLQRAQHLRKYCACALHPYRRRQDNFQRSTDQAAAEYRRLSDDIFCTIDSGNLWDFDVTHLDENQKVWEGRPRGCKRPAREVIRKLTIGSRWSSGLDDLDRHDIEEHHFLQLIGMAGRKRWAFWISVYVLECLRAHQADARRIIEQARKV